MVRCRSDTINRRRHAPTRKAPQFPTVFSRSASSERTLINGSQTGLFRSRQPIGRSCRGLRSSGIVTKSSTTGRGRKKACRLQKSKAIGWRRKQKKEKPVWLPFIRRNALILTSLSAKKCRLEEKITPKAADYGVECIE